MCDQHGLIFPFFPYQINVCSLQTDLMGDVWKVVGALMETRRREEEPVSRRPGRAPDAFWY